MQRRTLFTLAGATAATAASTAALAVQDSGGGSSDQQLQSSGGGGGDLGAALQRFMALSVTKSYLIHAGQGGSLGRIAHRPNLFLFTASAYKTFVLGQYLRDVEAGRPAEDSQLAIDDSVRMWGSPVFLYLAGKTPARSMLEAMITHSDNIATDIATGQVGADRVRALIAQAGLRSIRIPDSTRRFASYLYGAPAGVDLGWPAILEATENPPGPIRSPLNDVITLAGSARDFVSWYEQALAGAFFAEPVTLTEFKRIQAMSEQIPLAVPPDTPAYAKGGELPWPGLSTKSLAGQVVVSSSGGVQTPVTFCLHRELGRARERVPRGPGRVLRRHQGRPDGHQAGFAVTGRSRLPRSAALLAAVGIAAGIAALPSRAEAVYIRDDVPVALYNPLAEQPQYAAAGYFGIAGTGDRCSGVLVAPDAFLTAAHCTTDAPPSGFTVGFGLDLPATFGPSNVASILVNPAWVPASEDKPLSGKDQLANQLYDIALVKLAAPVAGIAPAQIWLGDPAGLVGTLTGYGYQDTGLNTGADAHGGEPGYYLGGAHSRLAAQNVIDTAGPDTPITAVFDSPHAGPGGDRGAPLPLEGSGCTGDSGSPLYVAIGGQNLIVGTVHGPPPGPGGGPPAVAGCGYGVVEAWAPLADPVNVAFLAGADSAIAFVAPEPVPEPASASVLGAALLGLVAIAVPWRRRGRDARPTRSTAAGGSARGRAGRDLVR